MFTIFSKVPRHSRHHNVHDHNKYFSDDSDFVERSPSDGLEASRPLIYPCQTQTRSQRSPPEYGLLIQQTCYFIFLLGILGSLIFLILHINRNINGEQQPAWNLVVGCSEIEVKDVWTVGLPKLKTNSAFRLVDSNQDGVLDIIFGFYTEAAFVNNRLICEMYFNGSYPCDGGLLTIDGLTGRELWRYYTYSEVFAVSCNVDFSGDAVPDCLIGGRRGAVSGQDGKMLWNFKPEENINRIMNLYTAQVVRDLNNDGVLDILAVHGGDPIARAGITDRLSGHILILSGKTGEVLQRQVVPDKKESYYSPQVYTLKDGREMVLFGTGGETNPGALWQVELTDLYLGKIEKAKRIYGDDYKGVIAPPVLADLTRDGTKDIIIPFFNSTIFAIDGENFDILWSHSFPNSETYATPAAGYYNDDDVPDFMVKYGNGPGFPVYHYSVTTVLDGKNGRPLVWPFINDTLIAMSSPLTVSVEGRGNDLFLYWSFVCNESDGDISVYELNRSESCSASSDFSKLYAISQHIKPPGATIYYSENRKELEFSKLANTTAELLKFVQQHPEYMAEYKRYFNYSSTEFVLLPEDLGMNRGTPQDEHSSGWSVLSKANKGTIPRSLPLNHKQFKNGEKYNNSYMKTVQSNTNSRNLSWYPHDENDTRYPPEAAGSPLAPFSGKTEADAYSLKEKGKMRRKHFIKRLNHFTNNGMKQLQRGQGKNIISDPSHIYSSRSSTFKGVKHFTNSYKMGKNKSKMRKTAEKSIRRKKRHDKSSQSRIQQNHLSTGTLAPSTLSPSHPDFKHSIDVIFAISWGSLHKISVSKYMKRCMRKRRKTENTRLQPSSKYYGMDHKMYEHAITKECLAISRHHAQGKVFYQPSIIRNPYNVEMGQMTVYRLRLKCKCKGDDQQKKKFCSRILPFDQQQWPSYMGHAADSQWLPRSDNWYRQS